MGKREIKPEAKRDRISSLQEQLKEINDEINSFNNVALTPDRATRLKKTRLFVKDEIEALELQLKMKELPASEPLDMFTDGDKPEDDLGYPRLYRQIRATG